MLLLGRNQTDLFCGFPLAARRSDEDTSPYEPLFFCCCHIFFECLDISEDLIIQNYTEVLFFFHQD